jgi:hypothetical protein
MNMFVKFGFRSSTRLPFVQRPAGRCDVFGMGIKVGVGGLVHAQWLAVTRC